MLASKKLLSTSIYFYNLHPSESKAIFPPNLLSDMSKQEKHKKEKPQTLSQISNSEYFCTEVGILRVK